MSKSKTKGKFAIAFAVLLMALSSATNLFSKRVMEGETIVISPISTDVPGTPRGPVFNPFTAYRLNSTVVLESDTSYGLINVTLVSTAGDHYTTVFDTEDGSILIPVSGNAGDYTLLLADSAGAQFVGTFEI